MHSKKPLIGLNADFRPAKKDTPAFSYLYAGYYDCIIQAGGIPVVLPPTECFEDVQQLLDVIDGMVLIGGADLDPSNDGFMTHPSIRTLHPRRERFDRYLMEQVAEHKTPVLGIGAGMQLLNVSQGGNLFFHLPEDMPKALPHKDLLDPNHRHALDVVPGTLMEVVYGEGEIRVNSNHHMAVDEVAPGFQATARCPDGVIEAIESTRDDWFAVGVQFHPESSSASALDQRIFEELVIAAAGRQAVKQPRPQLQLVA